MGWPNCPTWYPRRVLFSAWQITGSEGDYQLTSDLIADEPVVTDVQNTGGSSIISASIGDTIKVLGTALGVSTNDVEVTFGGVYGTLTSVTPGQIEVTVPENAVDGDIYVLRGGGRSNAYAFTVGVSSLGASSSTAPDSAWLNTSIGPKVYINRTLVTFKGSAGAADISNALDAVLVLDSNRDSWTQVGFSPRRNAYQIEWSWVSSYTPTWTDTESLLSELNAESDIAGVDPEYPVDLYSLDMPTDFDLLHDGGTARGAFAQVGAAEAQRLYRYSALGGVSSAPSVVLVDTGLQYGTPNWDPSTECITGSVGTGGTVDEFPSSHFSLVELSSSGSWDTTSAPGNYANYPATSKVAHGNAMAGVIGARSQGEPDWADGMSRSGLNANGLLAAFEQQGVDDDPAPVVSETDEVGESIPYTITVFNGLSQAGSTAFDGSNWLLFDAYEALATDPQYDDSVLVIANGWPGKFQMDFWHRHNKVVQDICRDRIVVAAAGNMGESIGTGPFGIGAWWLSDNALASDLAVTCPERSIIVGGTEAGDNGSGTDTRWTHPSGAGANYGEAVDLLAPASSYTTATVCKLGANPGYVDGLLGTSPASALVGATTAMVRGIVDPSALSDEGVVRLIKTSVDDISSLYTDDGAQSRLDLYEAIERALRLGGGLPYHLLKTVRIFAVDYQNDVLVAQDIEDLNTGTFAGSSTVDTTSVTSGGCYGPSDVEVHPSGDVVYVLCSDSSPNIITAYTSSDLDFIGKVSLEGVVTSYSELEITPDGIVRVPTINSSGELLLESFDSYTGSKHLDAESLYSASTLADAYAIRATHDTTKLAIVSTDGTTSTDDYDVLSLVETSPLDKASSTITTDDLSSTSGTYLGRDVVWRSDDSSAVAVLNGTASVGDVDSYESNWATVSSSAGIEYCEDVVSIALNPTGEDDYAYVACQDNSHFAVVNLASTASSYTPDFYLYGDSSSSGSGNYLPTIVEFSPNGRFVYGGFQYNGGGSSYSWIMTAEHDAVLSSGTSDLYLGSYDIMSYLGYDSGFAVFCAA